MSDSRADHLFIHTTRGCCSGACTVPPATDPASVLAPHGIRCTAPAEAKRSSQYCNKVAVLRCTRQGGYAVSHRLLLRSLGVPKFVDKLSGDAFPIAQGSAKSQQMSADQLGSSPLAAVDPERRRMMILAEDETCCCHVLSVRCFTPCPHPHAEVRVLAKIGAQLQEALIR